MSIPDANGGYDSGSSTTAKGEQQSPTNRVVYLKQGLMLHNACASDRRTVLENKSNGMKTSERSKFATNGKMACWVHQCPTIMRLDCFHSVRPTQFPFVADRAHGHKWAATELGETGGGLCEQSFTDLLRSGLSGDEGDGSVNLSFGLSTGRSSTPSRTLLVNPHPDNDGGQLTVVDRPSKTRALAWEATGANPNPSMQAARAPSLSRGASGRPQWVQLPSPLSAASSVARRRDDGVDTETAFFDVGDDRDGREVWAEQRRDVRAGREESIRWGVEWLPVADQEKDTDTTHAEGDDNNDNDNDGEGGKGESGYVSPFRHKDMAGRGGKTKASCRNARPWGKKAQGKGSNGDGDGGAEEKRNFWSVEHIIALIRAKRDQDVHMEGMGHAYARMKPREWKWQDVAQRLKNMGVDREADKCGKKWDNLMQQFKKVHHFQTPSGGQDFFQLNGKKRANRGFNFNMDRAVYDEIEGSTGKNHTIYPKNVADTGASSGVRMPTAASPDPESVVDGDDGVGRDDDEEGSMRGSSQTTGSPDGFGKRTSTRQPTFEAMTECMEKHGALMASRMESASSNAPSRMGCVLTLLSPSPRVPFSSSTLLVVLSPSRHIVAFSPSTLLAILSPSRCVPFSPSTLLAVLLPSRHTLAFSSSTLLAILSASRRVPLSSSTLVPVLSPSRRLPFSSSSCLQDEWVGKEPRNNEDDDFEEEEESLKRKPRGKTAGVVKINEGGKETPGQQHGGGGSAGAEADVILVKRDVACREIAGCPKDGAVAQDTAQRPQTPVNRRNPPPANVVGSSQVPSQGNAVRSSAYEARGGGVEAAQDAGEGVRAGDGGPIGEDDEALVHRLRAPRESSHAMQGAAKLWEDDMCFWNETQGNAIVKIIKEARTHLVGVARGVQPPAVWSSIALPHNTIPQHKIEDESELNAAKERAVKVQTIALRVIHGWIFKSESRQRGRGGCLSAGGRGTTAYGARKEPRRRLKASRSMAWKKLILVGPMEVNVWTTGSNGLTEMCGVIPEINDAKKKLTFDRANITEFLIDYENLATLLKWTEEEKMEHLGQHVSLSLGRDIMAIVASSGSWKESRNEMMRKYLKAEKMATEAELAAVKRKNYATYNDFLMTFTLKALRIPRVTDRIMSKYFLRQFSEFDNDKIMSAYQQTSKFEHKRDMDFNTVTDLAEKTVVTETLALLKEGEVIDLTGKTGDKVKKGIESLHEWVHGVDSKMDRMENALLVMQAQVSRPALPPQEAVVPAAVANRGFGRRDPANEQCKYCTMIGHFVRACPRLNHDIERQRSSRSLKGEILGPRGERVNWNSPGGMRRAVILLNNLEIVAVEAEPIADIVWDQPRGRGPQANFILEGNDQDRVNITTRRAGAENKLIQDTVMEELVGTSTGQQETEAAEQEKVYGKPREDEPVDKTTTAKKKFRYQISILTSPEIDGTLSKLLGTMVSVSFQTMLQASPRLLKGLRQLLTRKHVEVEEAPELQEQDTEEAEAPQGVPNLKSIPGGLGELEKAFADIRLSLPDHEGGEVMRAPLGTKLSFHALPVGKLKVQIGTHHTNALVDGGAEITLIRWDFATVTGCTVNKEVVGSIRGAGGKIRFTGYVTKCAVRAGIRESIWSFQRMTVMEEMDYDVILGRPWCANVEMIGMHLHDDTYMVDIKDPVTGRGELLRLLGTGGDPPKGKLATWFPTFEARKGAFARMEGMRERVEIMIEEAFSKKEWIKMGLPIKKRRPEDESLGVMVAEKEQEVELGASLPKPKEGRNETPELALEIPDLLHKVGVDPTTLAKFEDEVRKGYCLNGKIVSIQPQGSVRKYKPVGKKTKLVSILVETSKEEAMEKEEEILKVIRERRATEGDRIPNEVADTMKIGVEGFLTAEETQLIRKACQEFHLAFAFNDHQKRRLDAKLVPPVRIHTVQHECWNDKGPAYEFGIAAEVTDLLRVKIDSFVAKPTASPYANKWFVFRKPNKTLRWIQNLQKLNAVTIRDAGSLPQIDLLAESHAGRSIYSLVDLYSGYDQLPLDVRDRPYTAMHTPVGQLQMQVTSMGFTNAVAEAQRRMLAVAGDIFSKKCEPYIDDNPVKGARYKDETEVEPGVKRIAGLRNRADGLSRVCITLEGVEDAEPIDAFLEYEGGTLVVDNEMADPAITTGQLPIQTLGKGTPAVVAELREGPVTTVRRKEGKDSWGAEVGAREELMPMTVEGGRDAVMMLAETWAQKECQYLVNLTREEQGTDKNEQEFVLIQMLDDDPHLSTEELITARRQQVARNEEALEEVVNRVTDNRMRDKARWDQAGRGTIVKASWRVKLQEKKLYVGFDHNLVVNRGGRKQGTRGPSPLKEGEPIELPSDGDHSSKEEGNPEEGQRPGESEPVEFIDLTNDEEEDEVTTPTREDRGREEDPGEEKDP
ncbi:hypothetical protein CBR_g49832 [Chara braunii]|uniref:Myb-like domain-containing protein n=1 Tax=Chara braunii TaxID=69332 RepID=A0A388JPD7_CHABU|nr:hypothetical protein CBR_g49832 [Chara braunii]|eukprot:GBG59572.1 hypothetical protein CBR_g49832 [Chara braunii]